MRAQAAVEYFVMISIALFFLIPLSVYVNDLLIGYRDETRLSLARDVTKKIGENADWVFSQGPPARVSLRVYLPSGIVNASLQNRTILFRVRTSAGISDIYYTTVVELEGSLPTEEGYHSLSIKAFEDYVNISVVG